MHLSQKAKKALAAGLALSTVMWSVSFFALPAAFAAPHSEGCLVNSGGTVYLISGGQRRGFTSAEVFASHGYNFGQVISANAEDSSLPVGPILVYADGSIVKGPNDPLVYLVANGQKRGFVSGSVFTGLGYSFANIQWAPVNTFQDLPTGSNVETATERHPAGTWVKDGTGTVWMMTTTGRRGVPTLAVFNSYGKSWATIVAANAADLASSDEGLVAARAACTDGVGTPAGNVSASLASDNPAASTFIGGAVTAQALADMAHFSFTGSGALNTVTFERIGVSSNTTLGNVYLFNGATRVTDSASVGSDNRVTFAGLNISVPVTLSVRADIATSTAGQTVGMKLVAVNGTAMAISGNIHTIAAATLATVSLGAATGGGAIDPGMDINVWQSTATVSTRDVMFTRMALRQIGSIVPADIKNFRLLADGVQIASASSLDSNGYVTFSGNTTLKSGARTLKVLADVVGGSGRTYGMSLRGAYDFSSSDSQYNVPILTTTGSTFPIGPAAATINAGSMSVVKASDSQSQNIVVGASDQSLAKFTFSAFGEAVKVETLKVGMLGTTSGTITNATLRNVKVLVNGSQVGSTTDVPFAASFAANTGTAFTTNFYVTPGTATTVEIRGDVVDNEDNGADDDDILGGLLTAIQPTLVGGTGTSNGIPQVSLSAINVPAATNVTANSITVGSGSITLAQTSTYPAQSTTGPQSSYKLASWTLSGNANEAVNLNSLDVGFAGSATWDPSDDLTNVYLKYGSSTTSIKSTVADGSSTSLANTYSVNATIPVNGTLTVELWATIGSSVANADTMISYLRATGVTAISGVTKYADTDTDTDNTDAGSAGQTITISTGSVTATLDSSSPVAQLVDDTGSATSVVWKFAALVDSYTVTDLVFTIGSCTAVSAVEILDAGVSVASKPCATSITFSNLNIAVGANTNKLVSVKLTLSPIGYLAGSTDSSLVTTMVSFLARNSSGTSAAGTESNPAGNAMYAYKAVPLVSSVALPNASLAGGTMTIAKFTVSSNGTGTIAWKEVLLEISKPLVPTLASYALYDSDSGTPITAAFLVQNDTAANAACDGSDTSCELVVTVGTKADDDAVQSISGAKTYEVRATIGGALASGNFVAVTLDRNTSSHAASAIYVTNDAAATANSTSFTWSDESASATGDTGVATWQTDYLVKNLPLTWTLNRS